MTWHVKMRHDMSQNDSTLHGDATLRFILVVIFSKQSLYHDLAWPAWHGMTWHGTSWYDMTCPYGTWHGMASWHDTTWHGMEPFILIICNVSNQLLYHCQREGFQKKKGPIWAFGWFCWPLPRCPLPNLGPVSRSIFFIFLFKSTPFKTWNSVMEYF